MAVTPPPDRLEPRPPRKGRSVNGIYFDTSPGQATSAFVRPGQQATGLRKRTAQEIALSDYITKMEEARNKRVIGDDIGAAPGLIADVLYRHGIKYPIESGIRTATGQNAAVYLNPFNNVSPGERIARAGEDAINIASVIPGARAAAGAVGDTFINRFVAGIPARQAEQRAAWELYEQEANRIYARARARGLENPPPPPPTPPGVVDRFGTPPPVPRFTKEERAQLENLRPNYAKPPNQPEFTRAELAKKQAERQRPYVTSGFGTGSVADYPDVGPRPEGTIRVWHTNQTGKPLPEQLNPWEDYLGVETAVERRDGTPQGNLVSSGLYNTDARRISGSYHDLGLLQKNNPLGYIPTGSYIPVDAERFLPLGKFEPGDFVDINTPISQLSEFSNPNLLFPSKGNRIRSRGARLYTDPSKTPVVISANDLDISKWNFHGKPMEEVTLRDLINAAPNEEAARAVIMATEKPIKTTSSTTLKYPLYRNPGGSPTRSVMAREDMPAYLIENDIVENLARPRRVGEIVGDEIQSPRITVANADSSNPYTFEYGAKPYRVSQIRQGVDYGQELYPFPGNSPYGQYETIQSSPAQNYWDLPIVRDAETQAITSVGGMKALDIERVGALERRNIAQETRNWLINDYGISPNDPDLADVIDRIARDKNSSIDSLTDFRFASNDVLGLVNKSRAQRNLPPDKVGLDVWWKFLKDKMGYEAIPHTGGITRGDVIHQSFVFNSPEKLPPSTYVPSQTPKWQSDFVADEMNSYLRALSESRRGSRGRAPMPFRTPSGNYLQSLYSGYLANQGLRQSPQGRQNIR